MTETMNQQDFSKAIGQILESDKAAEFLAELNKRMPGVAEIEIANLYTNNHKFAKWLNNRS